MFETKLIPVAAIAAPSLVRTTNGHDKESLQGLAENISKHGLIQPLVVRPIDKDEELPEAMDGAYVIVAGRRRLAACKLAGMTDVPCMVTGTDQSNAYELEGIENLQREQLSLIDVCKFVRTLMMMHDDLATVCKIVGKSKPWVSKHLQVTSGTCPAVIKDMLDRELITDLDTLLYLKSIAELEAQKNASAAVRTTWARMLRITGEGNMSRQIARDALATLKTPKPEGQRVNVTENGGNQDSGLTVTQRRIIAPELIGIDTDPKTSFLVALPIDLLASFEQLGGASWLAGHLRGASV